MNENLLIAKLHHCQVFRTPYGVITEFQDGSTTSNWPPEGDDIQRIAFECGFDDQTDYIVDHDVSHAFLADMMWGSPSPVLWSAAHQNHIERTASLFEERWVYHWQRFARGLIEPIEPEWPDWLYQYKGLPASCHPYVWNG